MHFQVGARTFGRFQELTVLPKQPQNFTHLHGWNYVIGVASGAAIVRGAGTRPVQPPTVKRAWVMASAASAGASAIYPVGMRAR